MLLGTVVLWALNITVTRYVVIEGWSPLAYATIRYLLAILLFVAYTHRRERSFAIHRRHRRFVLLAGLLIFANQVCFVYSVKFANATTIALLFGTTPMFTGVLALVLGIERLSREFWIGAAVTACGVALVAVGSGPVDARPIGILLGTATAASWACYTIAIAPLMRCYSPFRISAIVLPIGWIPLAILGVPQIAAQSFTFGWEVWLGFAYAVVGPLFLTNILWFTAISRVGPSRAALFANLEPLVAAIFALVLLSESLSTVSMLGGALIFVGIALERLWRRGGSKAGPQSGASDAVAPLLE